MLARLISIYAIGVCAAVMAAGPIVGEKPGTYVSDTMLQFKLVGALSDLRDTQIKFKEIESIHLDAIQTWHRQMEILPNAAIRKPLGARQQALGRLQGRSNELMTENQHLADLTQKIAHLASGILNVNEKFNAGLLSKSRSSPKWRRFTKKCRYLLNQYDQLMTNVKQALNQNYAQELAQWKANPVGPMPVRVQLTNWDPKNSIARGQNLKPFVSIRV